MAMKSVGIIYDEPDWAFHHQARAMAKYAPSDFRVSMTRAPRIGPWDLGIGEDPVDLYLFMPINGLREFYRALAQRKWNPTVVGLWATGWPHLSENFEHHFAQFDALICKNSATGRIHAGRRGIYSISNGVDLSRFNVQVPLSKRRHKMLWVGSELYRKVKGYDEFVLPLADELATEGIESELRLVDSLGSQKFTPTQMATWYNSGTILVCASETEGTPNPALEAAACGCTLVSTNVGNMPELIVDNVNGYLVNRNVKAMKRAVLAARANYPRLAARMQKDIAYWHWRDRVSEYFGLFRRLLSGDAPLAQRAIEIRDH